MLCKTLNYDDQVLALVEGGVVRVVTPCKSHPVHARRIVGVYRKSSALLSVLDPRYRFCKLSEIRYNLELDLNTRKYKLVLRSTSTE